MPRTFVSTFSPRFVIAGLVSLSLFVVLAGCSSSSDGGNPDTGTTTCDLAGAQAVLAAHICTVGGCHDASGTSAGLNLTSTGLEARLLDVMPATGGLSPSVCTGMSKVYLKKGSNPATGLFLDKLTANPGCGARMPSGGTPLNATEMACIQSWATGLTTR